MDLQKANMWKRFAAWLLDSMLLLVMAVGFIAALSSLLGYDTHNVALQNAYADYEDRYSVQFNLTQDEYAALSETELEAYQQAYEALIADETVLYEYSMVVNLSLAITTVGILLGILCTDFVIPLLLKNGQTLGKKAFGLGVVRPDSLRITALQMFVRTLLGKYTVETMIPVYIALTLIWGTLNMTGLIICCALLLGQVICICVTRNRCAIHDQMAGTVVVDLASQKVFQSSQELIDYTNRIQAERAQRQDY